MLSIGTYFSGLPGLRKSTSTLHYYSGQLNSLCAGRQRDGILLNHGAAIEKRSIDRYECVAEELDQRDDRGWILPPVSKEPRCAG